MSDMYILLSDKKTPILTDDLLEWGRWMEKRDRVVAVSEWDGVKVSTVFLGLDHNFWGGGPPILWETLVFEGEYDGDMECYTSYDDALEGHKAMCTKVFGEPKPFAEITITE